jgi:hypothetical protein
LITHGLGHLCKTKYQQLSMAHAHPNLRALNSIIESDENEEPVGLRWGPEWNADDDLVHALCLSFVVYNLILDEWMKHQPDQTMRVWAARTDLPASAKTTAARTPNNLLLLIVSSSLRYRLCCVRERPFLVGD